MSDPTETPRGSAPVSDQATHPSLPPYEDGFPERIVRLAKSLHATRELWLFISPDGTPRLDPAEAVSRLEFGHLPNDVKLHWLRLACIAADDESLKVASDLPDLHATAYNVVVNQGSDRLWRKKLPSLQRTINRTRDAFERTLAHLHGNEHVPCLPECVVRSGGLFHADDCPHHHSNQ